MSKVECLAVAGVDFVFHSNDHGRPHFHALKADEWEAKVFFMEHPEQMIEVQWEVKHPSGRLIRVIRKLAEQSREGLLQEWQIKVQL